MESTYVNEPYEMSALQAIYDLQMKLKFDEVTYRHSINVANYCVQFSKCLEGGINESLLYYSGLLHDVGKSQIDPKILNKPSALKKDEFCIMQQHPSNSYTLLLLSNFPEKILEAVLYHHERYDGSGYPVGLKGDEIPLLARIISICDVFDALTSNRPYRKSYSAHEALQIMSNSKGQFDPKLFHQFIKLIPDVLYAGRVG